MESRWKGCGTSIVLHYRELSCKIRLWKKKGFYHGVLKRKVEYRCLELMRII